MNKTIEFKIEIAGNCDVYQSGYVEVPDCEDEECNWYYYEQNGMSVSRMFTHHDGIGLDRWTENHVKVVLSTKFDFHYQFTTRQLDKIYDFLTGVNGEKIEER